jgi:hypothetical protein
MAQLELADVALRLLLANAIACCKGGDGVVIPRVDTLSADKVHVRIENRLTFRRRHPARAKPHNESRSMTEA